MNINAETVIINGLLSDIIPMYLPHTYCFNFIISSLNLENIELVNAQNYPQNFYYGGVIQIQSADIYGTGFTNLEFNGFSMNFNNSISN